MRGVTVSAKFHVRKQAKGRNQMKHGERRAAVGDGVPRISRLMALAIRFEGLIRDGVVTDQAELARLGGVSRARLTQVTNLLSLAPDLQEELLFRNREAGRQRLTERGLRGIAEVAEWEAQRRMWRALGEGAGL